MQRIRPLLYAAALVTVALALFWPHAEVPPADNEPLGTGNPGVLILRQKAAEAVRSDSAAEARARLCEICELLRCAPPVDPEPGPTRLVRLPFWRHASISLTNADADSICRRMSELVSGRDYPDDAAPQVQYLREGDVRVLPGNLAAVVQTANQLNALFAVPGVKRVRGINYCGGAGSNIIGCAPLNSPVVNVLWAFDQDPLIPITVAHEIGHNNGCQHVPSDQRNLMYPSVGPNRLLLTGAQARLFLAGPQSLTSAEPLAADAPCATCDAPLPDAQIGILDAVRQHYVEGSHALDAQLQTFDAGDGATLVRQLAKQDPRDEEYLANFAHAIAALGTLDAVPTLDRILHDRRASPAVWRAKHAVLIGLGRLIDRAGDPQAVDLLAAVAAQPQAAAACVPQQPLALMSDPDVIPASDDELAAELALSAKIALESAKHPAAAARVQALRQQPVYARLGE